MYDGEERREDWYSPKEMFEMICELKIALIKTTAAVEKYNNLREELRQVGEEQIGQAKEIVVIRAEDIKTRAIAEARTNTKENIIEYVVKLWPIVIMTVLFILTMMSR